MIDAGGKITRKSRSESVISKVLSLCCDVILVIQSNNGNRKRQMLHSHLDEFITNQFMITVFPIPLLTIFTAISCHPTPFAFTQFT